MNGLDSPLFIINLAIFTESILCTYQCYVGGGGNRAGGGDLIVFVGPGVGHLTDLVLPGEGIYESFFARCGDI